MKYVALLRGINVGGNNLIKMADLRATFESLGFTGVATFIASGNVIFEAKSATKPRLTKQIETALSRAFAYESKIVLASADELTAVVTEAPEGFGTEPDRYRYDVVFVKPPVTPVEALPDFELAAGVDDVWAGTHALYFRRLTELASKSRLSKIISKPVYKSLTIRNWNTTQRLRELMST